MERATHLQSILHIFQKPHKNSSKLKGRKKEAPLHIFPKRAPMEADAHFQALFNITFGVPSKGALPHGPLHGIPRRKMPHS